MKPEGHFRMSPPQKKAFPDYSYQSIPFIIIYPPILFPLQCLPQSEITLFIYCLSPPLERQPHEGKDLSSALFTAVIPVPSKPLINTC